MAGSRFVAEGGLLVPNNASNSTLNTTTVDGVLTASANLVVSGTSSLGGNVSVSGQNLNVSSNATFSGNIVFTSTVQFDVPPILIGAQIVNGDITPFNNTFSLGSGSSVWSTLHSNNVIVYTGNISVGNSTINAFANSTTLRISSNSTANVTLTSTTVSVGTASINATNFSGTSNNALYLGGTLAASYATNTYLQTLLSSPVANATFASTAGALTTTNNYRVNSLGVATDASGTSGEIRATGNITAYYSDMRLKKFVGPIVDPLAKLKQLSGFYYTGNETAGKLGYNTTKTEVGVSAQDVEKVLPEIVQPAPIDPQYMTLDYGRLVPLLIEAIKELSDKVETLERKLEK